MWRIFDMENPVMRALAVACDLLLLNLLALLCCVPVITAGASITALNDLTIRIVRQEDEYIVRPFFRSFADNFRKATLLWLLVLLAAALLGVDYLAALSYIPALRVGIIAIGIIVFAVALYAFALLARYENSLRATVRNAAALSVAYFPRTLGMLAATVLFWALCLRFYQIGAPLLLLFGLALPCYLNATLLNGVFRKLDENAPPEDGACE